MKRSLSALVLSLIFCGAGISQTLRAEEAASENLPATARQQAEERLAAEFQGVGPAISGSVTFEQLPSRARKFLQKYCNGHAVVRCDKIFSHGSYVIELADGIRFEFDSRGNVIETTAPEGYSLSRPMLRAVVPGKFYHLLIHNGFDQCVDRVERTSRNYRVDIDDPVFSAVAFDPRGVLTLVTAR